MNHILKKISLAALSVASLVLMSSSSTSALSGSEFNAGRIIDDSVFFNSNSMSVTEIQNFLNSKVDCDFDGSEMVGGITRAQYAAQRGWPTTFTCLPQYRENVTTKANNIGSPFTNPAGSISAAQIIYNASAEHGVSSKALIVLLQKEQSLVTDEWPVPRQYQIATGYGCPDTAPCDEQYYGFYNQVNKAAYQFKRYVNNPGGYRYKAGQVNSIYWSPTLSCGASNVFIENGATAALYNYTPYRPNQAALDNLYGTGDGCSAYGNRNFWRMFRDWFGNTLTNIPPFAWEFAGQTTYVDGNMAATRDTSLFPGETAFIVLRARNTGTETWSNSVNPVRLGTERTRDRASGFCDPTWLGRDCNRPAVLQESTVAPGQIGTFMFTFKAIDNGLFGTFNEYFNLVADGRTWFNNDPGLYWTMTIKRPNYRWSVVSQAAYTDSSKTNSVDTSQLQANSRYYLEFKARNTGNISWIRGMPRWQVNTASSNPNDRRSAFCDINWLNVNCDRPVSSSETTVGVGQQGTFGFWITTPGQSGAYNEYFNLVADGRTWLNNPGMYWTLKVQ